MVRLGSYRSPEEAAAAVKKKKAEFQQMFQLKNRLSTEIGDDEYEGIKLPFSVGRMDSSVSGGQFRQSKLRRYASLGSYISPEDVAFAFSRKRARLQKMCGSKKGVETTCECTDGVVSKSECSDKYSTVKLPAGDRKTKSGGEWVAMIQHPETRARIWLGTYNTSQEAVTACDREKAVLALKREIVESDSENNDRLGSEAIHDTGDFECEFDYLLMTSVLDSENSNRRDANDKLNLKEIIYGPVESQNRFGYYLETSVSEPVGSNAVDGSDETGKHNKLRTVWPANFDEAVSLGFIDEYGQLLGTYSVVDEQMGLTFELA